jgi:quercetin dioxygenase-like cupin family protein
MESLLFACLLSANVVALDNDYVLVTRDAVQCASADDSGFSDHIIVALGDIEVSASDTGHRMVRGDIAVFKSGESFALSPGASFFDVTIKTNHPRVESPPEIIPPEKNAMRYDGDDYFIFEEKLAPGDTRARHSHSQRVVMQLNRTRLLQWPDGKPEVLVETFPDRVTFNPPVIHTVKNIGDGPLRGIIIEFKPPR